MHRDIYRYKTRRAKHNPLEHAAYSCGAMSTQLFVCWSQVRFVSSEHHKGRQLHHNPFSSGWAPLTICEGLTSPVAPPGRNPAEPGEKARQGPRETKPRPRGGARTVHMGQGEAGQAPEAQLPPLPLMQARGRCRTRLEDPGGVAFPNSPSSEGSDSSSVEDIWWRAQRRAKIPAVRTRRPARPRPAQAQGTSLERTRGGPGGLPSLAAMERKGKRSWPRSISPSSQGAAPPPASSQASSPPLSSLRGSWPPWP